MWNGKSKALTFSFDDGVTQDIRLVELFNKYGLKGTFNLNSALLGLPGELDRNGHRVSHHKVRAMDVPSIYRGQEVAVHTLTHPNLSELDDETVIYQVEQDRAFLSNICGYEVRGMAYPFFHCGEHVETLIREKTGVCYARTVASTYNFEPQTDYFAFHPTVYYIETDKMFELGKQFLALQTETPKIFFIWGHSYEMDAEYLSWERFEEFCKMMSGRDDIFYGTNSEVLLP